MADQGKVCITMTVPENSNRGIILGGDGAVANGTQPAGVLFDSTDVGQTTGQVQVYGTALVVLGDTVSAGDSVISDANGAATAATLGTTDPALILGVALEGGASGELRNVLIK